MQYHSCTTGKEGWDCSHHRTPNRMDYTKLFQKYLLKNKPERLSTTSLINFAHIRDQKISENKTIQAAHILNKTNISKPQSPKYREDDNSYRRPFVFYRLTLNAQDSIILFLAKFPILRLNDPRQSKRNPRFLRRTLFYKFSRLVDYFLF